VIFNTHMDGLQNISSWTFELDLEIVLSLDGLEETHAPLL
jgi:hypothetical protein